MIHFIKRLLGWECCGEWTQWVSYVKTYKRPHKNMVDRVVAGTEKLTYTITYQERRCTICGYKQQRKLNY